MKRSDSALSARCRAPDWSPAFGAVRRLCHALLVLGMVPAGVVPYYVPGYYAHPMAAPVVWGW